MLFGAFNAMAISPAHVCVIFTATVILVIWAVAGNGTLITLVEPAGELSTTGTVIGPEVYVLVNGDGASDDEMLNGIATSPKHIAGAAGVITGAAGVYTT